MFLFDRMRYGYSFKDILHTKKYPLDVYHLNRVLHYLDFLIFGTWLKILKLLMKINTETWT